MTDETKGTKKNSRYYIDKKELLQAFVEYRTKIKEAEESGDEMPPVPNYIGKSILLLVEKMGTAGNFSGYSYIDEMKDDAIENCVVAAKNFNPEKSSNPFGYLSMIAWRAFLRRISKEKKENALKYKKLIHMYVFDENYAVGEDDRIIVDTTVADQIVSDYENKKERDKVKAKNKKKGKVSKKGIDVFVKED